MVHVGGDCRRCRERSGRRDRERKEARAPRVHQRFLILSDEAQAGPLHRPRCRLTLSHTEESGNLQTLPPLAENCPESLRSLACPAAGRVVRTSGQCLQSESHTVCTGARGGALIASPKMLQAGMGRTQAESRTHTESLDSLPPLKAPLLSGASLYPCHCPVLQEETLLQATGAT